MGMSCSLSGHLWEDDTYVETEHKTCKSGEIIIRRELQDCSRCNETNVIKENKTAKESMNEETMDGETQEIAADGGRTPDDGDEGVVIMSDDDENPSSGSHSDPVEQTTDQNTGFDPDAHNANTNVGDVGPEGNTTQQEEQASKPSHSGEVIPDSEQHNVQIMGSAEQTTTHHNNDSISSKDVSPEQDAVICPDCSFSAPVEEVTVFAGDACPECRHAYLEKEEN